MSDSRAVFKKTFGAARTKGVELLGKKILALEKLLDVSRKISSLDLNTSLRLIVKSLLEMTGGQRGMVMLQDSKGSLNLEFGVNLGPDDLENQDFEISRSVTERAIDTGEVIIVADIPASSVRDRKSIVKLGLKAVMAIPLKTTEMVIGAIYVDTNQNIHNMSDWDPSVFSAFGSQAAITLENARLHRQLKEDCLFLKDPNESLRFDLIVYQSRGMHRVRHTIQQVLDNDITVMIHGQSGTGKELVAHAIHFQGSRKNQKFVTQNTGALPDALLESELFGHRRGSFSGAVEDKAGLFEVADGGTVFLDEIGEASPALQVRLLRLLETRTFRRVGEMKDRTTEVRIIAATHRDLEKEVKAGRFREDLYYRLNVFPIHIPPLCERREDIPLLANHFIDECNAKLNKSIYLIPKKIMDRLENREWKGNVREFKNFIYRMMVLSPDDRLSWPEEDFEPVLDDSEESEEALAYKLDSLKTMDEMEIDYIRYVLKCVNGNQVRAAEKLGMKRTTLRSRMKKLGVTT